MGVQGSPLRGSKARPYRGPRLARTETWSLDSPLPPAVPMGLEAGRFGVGLREVLVQARARGCVGDA